MTRQCCAITLWPEAKIRERVEREPTRDDELPAEDDVEDEKREVLALQRPEGKALADHVCVEIHDGLLRDRARWNASRFG